MAATILLPWGVGTAAASLDPGIHDTASLATPSASIVFVSGDGLWSVDPDGSDLVRLTHRENDLSPTWDSGRTSIMFVRAMTTSEGIGQLRLIDPDGSNPTVVPDIPGTNPRLRPTP